MKRKKSLSERIADLIIILLNGLVVVITLYPFMYVLSMSISDPVYAMKQEVFFLPKGFSLEAYKLVLKDPGIWTSYYNSLWYTVVGTVINVLLTVALAYPLSRKTFFARNSIMMFMAFTMFFSGGLIPQYLVVNALNLYNTRWAIILPTAVTAFNAIMARTFFETIPESLQESAKIDGANDFTILMKIILPLSKPILAVLTLFYAVAQWNGYFQALIYLPNVNLQPIQLFLYKILIQQQESLMEGVTNQYARSLIGSQLKYAAIMVTILPIVLIYPFLQKYFVKGVMIGAVKE